MDDLTVAGEPWWWKQAMKNAQAAKVRFGFHAYPPSSSPNKQVLQVATMRMPWTAESQVKHGVRRYKLCTRHLHPSNFCCDPWLAPVSTNKQTLSMPILRRVRSAVPWPPPRAGPPRRSSCRSRIRIYPPWKWNRISVQHFNLLYFLPLFFSPHSDDHCGFVQFPLTFLLL